MGACMCYSTATVAADGREDLTFQEVRCVWFKVGDEFLTIDGSTTSLSNSGDDKHVFTAYEYMHSNKTTYLIITNPAGDRVLHNCLETLSVKGSRGNYARDLVLNDVADVAFKVTFPAGTHAITLQLVKGDKVLYRDGQKIRMSEGHRDPAEFQEIACPESQRMAVLNVKSSALVALKGADEAGDAEEDRQLPYVGRQLEVSVYKIYRPVTMASFRVVGSKSEGSEYLTQAENGDLELREVDDRALTARNLPLFQLARDEGDEFVISDGTAGHTVIYHDGKFVLAPAGVVTQSNAMSSHDVIRLVINE